MTELEKAARMALEALESAKNGLIWYREQHPEDNSAADDEMIEDIDATFTALTQALATTEPKLHDTLLRVEDVKVDVLTKQAGGFAPIMSSGVRLTHVPSGISVTVDTARSQHANRHLAWERLAMLVATPMRPDDHLPDARKMINAEHQSFMQQFDDARENIKAISQAMEDTTTQQATPEPVKPLFAAKVAAQKWAELQEQGHRMQSLSFDGGPGGAGTIDPWGVVAWGTPERKPSMSGWVETSPQPERLTWGDDAPERKGEPFGQVTVKRPAGSSPLYTFYPWPQSPYLDNVQECHTVYTSPQVPEDTERLDWLSENPGASIVEHGGIWFFGSNPYDSLREAIDAARKGDTHA